MRLGTIQGTLVEPIPEHLIPYEALARDLAAAVISFQAGVKPATVLKQMPPEIGKSWYVFAEMFARGAAVTINSALKPEIDDLEQLPTQGLIAMIADAYEILNKRGYAIPDRLSQ